MKANPRRGPGIDHRSRRLNRALSTGWLLAGLTVAGLGVAYLTSAGRLGWRSPACANYLASSCAPIAGPVMRATTSALITAATAAVLLAGRWIAVRYIGLAPARRGLVVTAGMLLALAAFAIGAVVSAPALHVSSLDPGASVLVIATALIECLAAAVSLADPRAAEPVSLRPSDP